MGCYIVPTTTAIIHYYLRRKIPSWRESKSHARLNTLLLGGALFGVVDHAWNGELFFGKEGLLMDLLLGVTITFTIFIVAGLLHFADAWRVTSTTTS